MSVDGEIHPGTCEKKNNGSHSNSVGVLLSNSQPFFTWEASLHRPTGVASSNELSEPFSITKKKVSLWPSLRKETSHRTAPSKNDPLDLTQEQRQHMQQIIKEKEDIMVEISRQFIKTWPDFLCRGSISLGILRCIKERNNSLDTKRRIVWRRQRQTSNLARSPGSGANTTTVSSSSLVPRFVPFPVKLLEFGKIVETKPPLCIDDNGSNEFHKGDLVVLGSWDIPLQGGALVLDDDQILARKLSSSRKSGPDYRGRLIFAIAKRSELSHEGKYNKSFKHCNEGNRYQIITGIRDYRPWLAGGGYSSKSEENKSSGNIWNAIKANRVSTTRFLNHAFYLSTQSMVHAYVTWRFHHAWKRQLAIAFRKHTMTTTDTENF